MYDGITGKTIIKGLCKNMDFSHSTLRTQRNESIKPGLSVSNVSILSVTFVSSVRNIFFAFIQSLSAFPAPRVPSFIPLRTVNT